MLTLYLVSAEGAAGKTAICAGLGRNFFARAKKVGYLRLTPNGTGSGDAAFLKDVLPLPEPAESLCFTVTDSGAGANQLKDAYNSIAAGKDVILIEGSLSQVSYEIARVLNARVIVLAGYTSPLKLTDSYSGFGQNLLGVIVNKVPASQLKRVREEASARCQQVGIKLLGVLPEDRALLSPTVAELAECIHGKIINNEEKASELVENFMLGAMVVDSGLDYFGRKTGKAAIIRGDRPDMQLAALETDTRCLILTSYSQPPVHNVMAKAKRKGIPVILTGNDTNAVVATVEDALMKLRFTQEKKLPGLMELLQKHLDFNAIGGG